MRRIWVPQVAVDVVALGTRVEVAEARGLDPAGTAVAEGIRIHLSKASAAAFRLDPLPRRFMNWWRGTLVEAAYRHMHAAQAQLVDLYDDGELGAEIPVAVARARSALHREDPRQPTMEELQACPLPQLRPRLRRLATDSFAALEGKHAQLRNFRNILLMAALVISLLVAITVGVAATWPHVLPLCFPYEEISESGPVVVTEEHGSNCPTTPGPDAEAGPGDVPIVALLGLLGGALTASVAIRNLKGTTTPYDVPVALAWLKVPLGAFTAILGLVAIRADFVPGLSVLDSQEQILAYAVVLGFAQQLFTRLLDQQAQRLLDDVPAKDVKDEPAQPPPARTAHVPMAARRRLRDRF